MPNRSVQTVLGPVPAEALGHTQLHEHLLCDLTSTTTPGAKPWEYPTDHDEITLWNYYETRRHHPPHDLRLLDRDVAVAELALYTASGGGTIVDATSLGLGRDPDGLHEIATGSGVHVVMGCGYYWHDYHPDGLAERSAASITAEIVADVTEGVGDTGIRAGIIGEIGLAWPLHPTEETVLCAAVAAQRETGACLLVHPGRDEAAPLDAMRVVESAGGAADRVVMSHVDRTLFSAADILALAATGCYVELDLFGQETCYYPLSPIDMPNDATRVDYVVELVAHGYLDRVLVAQDICHKTNLRTYGGEGYAHILDDIVPLMRRKGLTEGQIRTITVDNPANALAGHP